MKHTLSRLIARLSRRILRPLVAASTVLPWLFAAAVAGAQAPAASQNFGPDALEQIRLLQMEKAQLAPHQRKIDSRLRRMLDATSPSPKFPGLAALRRPAPQADGMIALDVDTFTGGDVKAVIEVVEAAGGTVVFPSTEYKTVRARVAPAAIEALALLPGVRFVTLAREAITNKVNTSQGDVTHRAAAARSFFGYDGTGVKVCVLSDGVSSLASVVATGDLPPGVDVLPGQAGSGDEGTAMLEIVHDLAPGAPLGFATAFISEASFAANIVALKDAGCKIIVDDVVVLRRVAVPGGPGRQRGEHRHRSGRPLLLIGRELRQQGPQPVGNVGRRLQSQRDDHASPMRSPDLHSGVPGRRVYGPQLRRRRKVDPGDRDLGQSDHAALERPVRHVGQRLRHVPDGRGPHDDRRRVGQRSEWQRHPVRDHGRRDGRRPAHRHHPARGGSEPRAQPRDQPRPTRPDARDRRQRPRSQRPQHDGQCVGHARRRPLRGPPNPTGPYPSPFNATNQAELFTSDGPRRMYFDFAGNFLPGAPVGNYTSRAASCSRSPTSPPRTA